MINQDGFCHLESRTDITDGYNMTPLLCAVKGNAVDTFNILISNGADIAAKDLHGHGVVEVAVSFASIDVFEHLLVHRFCRLLLVEFNFRISLFFIDFLLRSFSLWRMRL